jgi:hypothetical protein
MWPPPFLGFFEWVATLPGSMYLREDAPNFFGTFLTLHVLSMCLFLGLVFMMDLRLIGVAHLDTPVSQIQKRLFPWQFVGALVMAISGFVLFYAQPVLYWGKGFYWIKMLLVMPLAILNLLVFHYTTYRSVADWDTRPSPPFAAKVAGVLSIVLWVAVLCFGRLVAYDWWTIVEQVK